MKVISCDTCRFSCDFPEPGPAPVKPGMPKGFWRRLFFDHDRAYWDWQFAEARHLDEVRRHEELVRCRRHPETLTKHKDDVCGEFQP